MENESNSFPGATLFGSHLRRVRSSIAEQDYLIPIWLPPDYYSTEKRYPVVYLLDANIMFGLATDITFLLTRGNEIPEVIIVGIGYDIQSYDDWDSGRLRDMSPAPYAEWTDSGKAGAFLSFLETELIPLIDSDYRTEPQDRTLWGYSLGGLFILYTLFSKPGVFHRYVAGSPYVSWNDRWIFNYEKAFADQHPSLVAKLAITYGSLEDDFMPNYASDIDALSAIVQHRRYEGLRLTTLCLEGETHFSGVSRAYTQGLKAIFR